MSSQLVCPSEEALIEAGMGEELPGEVQAHLLECAGCRQRVDRLRELADSWRQTVSSAPAKEPTTIIDNAAPATARPAMIGKYPIVGELGKGGQARVFRGLHPSLDRDVAIKWAKQNVSPAMLELLVREGKILAELEHPAIARVFDLDVHEGRPFLVLEYVRGRNLEQYVGRERLAPQRAAALVADLARALAYAHARGVVHQDIKPSNILVDEQGRPKLADFGLAHCRDIWNQGGGQPSGGTLDFMAPEQMSNPASVGPVSDIYGLGGVLFFLLTGQGPRRLTANPVLAGEQVARGEIDWTPLEESKAPRRLIDICRRTLAADPAQRYQKAEELADDLERFMHKPLFWRPVLGGLAACLALVMIGWSVYGFLKPTVPAIAAGSRPAALRQFALEVIRNGDGKVLATQADLDGRLPFLAKDELRLAATVPNGIKPGLFAVTLTDSGLIATQFELKEIKGQFQHPKTIILHGSPATELLFTCGTSDQAPALGDVQAILTAIAAKREKADPKALILPTNYLVPLLAEGVADPLSRPHIKGSDNDVFHLLDEIGKALGGKYSFVAGIAFTHVAADQDSRGQRTEPEAPQIPKESAWGGGAADQKLFRAVMDRLLQTDLVRKNYPREFIWPPFVYIQPASKKIFNAFAGPYAKEVGSGKYRVRAFITEGYMDAIVKEDPEILAAIMGHELAHITKGHLFDKVVVDLAGLALSRQQEIEADLEGVRIAGAAGFSPRSGVKAAMREWEKLGDYSNFEGIRVSHPSWADRLALLDQNEKELWQAMAAFQNGVYFLHSEQYETAVDCFVKVTDEFPKCAEAWANLGYARLMLYCDSLSETDLRNLGIAQFAAGGFYARPEGLVSARGDEKLWLEAVSALKTAVKKDDKLVLARANLGLAYLVHPKGKDVKEALGYFRSAYNPKDKGVNNLNLAALLVNFGVAEMAAGQTSSAADKFRIAKQALPPRGAAIRHQLDLAILYNQAILKAGEGRDGKAQAFRELEDYLNRASPDSTWWPLAYERYGTLGKELGFEPLPKEKLAARFGGKLVRMVGSLEIDAGKRIVLGDATAGAFKLLGREPRAGIPIYQRSRVNRYRDVAPGIDLLADHQVLAIFLTSEKAPPVYVQGQDRGSKKEKLYVGMTTREFLAVVKDQPADPVFLDRSAVEYIFMPELGVGIRLDGERISEIVLAQPPRKTRF